MPEQTSSDQQKQPEQNNGEAQSSQAPGSDSALETTGFKWGSEAPPELQGKTPKETLQSYTQLADSVRNYITQTQRQQQQQAAVVAAAQTQQRAAQKAQNNKQIADMWFNEPEKAMAAFGSQIQQSVGGQMGQVIAPLYAAQAETAKALARGADTEVWNKYGAEIERLVASVPLAAKANPELWKQAARIAKANHLDEIVAERATAVANAAESGVESGRTHSATGGGGSALIEKLKESDYGQRLVADYGERGALKMVDKVAEARGITPLAYAEQVAKTHVRRNTKNAGEWKTSYDPKTGVVTNV